MADATSGIIDWLRMFGKVFMTGISEAEQDAIMLEVQDGLRDNLLIDGKWHADYKRLRIRAVKR